MLCDARRSSCSLSYDLRRVAVELLVEFFMLPLIAKVSCKDFSGEMASF